MRWGLRNPRANATTLNCTGRTQGISHQVILEYFVNTYHKSDETIDEITLGYLELTSMKVITM